MVAAALSRLQADPGAFDAVLAAHGDTEALRPLLQALLQTRRAVHDAQADAARVADVLRRDQKFAPAGRPSLHLVQLRQQQARTQQAARVAGQAHARAAQDFARAMNLALGERRTPTMAAARWLEKTAR